MQEIKLPYVTTYDYSQRLFGDNHYGDTDNILFVDLAEFIWAMFTEIPIEYKIRG